MKNQCQDCEHFRSFRPLSQLLLRDVGATDPQIVSEILKVMQDERDKKGQEASIKVEVFRKGQSEWPFRPSMSDYCGVSETEGKYFVHEIKNADRGCKQHEPGGAEKACGTCCHHVDGRGAATDAETLTRLGRLKLANAVVEGGSGDGGVAAYIELMASLKSLEIAQAYYAGRFTVRPPDYLQICAKRSRPKSWAPCIVENPHDACHEWESTDDQKKPDDFMKLFRGKPSG